MGKVRPKTNCKMEFFNTNLGKGNLGQFGAPKLLIRIHANPKASSSLSLGARTQTESKNEKTYENRIG